MNLRRAEKQDIPGMIELLHQVGDVHHGIRPDLFRNGALKYDEAALEELLMCESKREKVSRLLKAAEYIEDVHDELIERYFLDVESYFNEGYQV